MKKKNVPAWLRKETLARDVHACVRCGWRANLAVHHVFAVYDGGADTLDNTATMCSPCHNEWHHSAELQGADFKAWLNTLSPAPLSLLMSMELPSEFSFQEVLDMAMRAWRSVNEVNSPETAT